MFSDSRCKQLIFLELCSSLGRSLALPLAQKVQKFITGIHVALFAIYISIVPFTFGIHRPAPPTGIVSLHMGGKSPVAVFPLCSIAYFTGEDKLMVGQSFHKLVPVFTSQCAA